MADEKGTKRGVSAAIEAGYSEPAAPDPAGADDQPTLLPLKAHHITPEKVKAAGPGRPKGARNKATKDMVRLMRTKYGGDPLEFLWATFSTPTDKLAEELICDRDKAFAFQQAAAVKCAEIVHGKAPVQVNQIDNRQATVIMGAMGQSNEELTETAQKVLAEYDAGPVFDFDESGESVNESGT